MIMKDLVNYLVSQGLDFSKEVWDLNHNEFEKVRLLAMVHGYKKCSLRATGVGFYNELQKVYKQMAL